MLWFKYLESKNISFTFQIDDSQFDGREAAIVDAELRAYKIGKGKQKPPTSLKSELLKASIIIPEDKNKESEDDDPNDPFITFDDAHLMPENSEQHKRIETHYWDERETEGGSESENESEQKDSSKTAGDQGMVKLTVKPNVVKKFNPKTGKSEFLFTGDVSDMDEEVKKNIRRAVTKAKKEEIVDFEVDNDEISISVPSEQENKNWIEMNIELFKE